MGKIRVRSSGTLLLSVLLAFTFASEVMAGAVFGKYPPDRGPNRLGWDSPDRVLSAARALNRGKKSLAVRHARRALRGKIRRTVDLKFSLYIACVVQTDIGSASDALPYCDRAVRELSAQNGEHLNNRANALVHSGQLDRAILDYEAALEFFRAQETDGSDEAETSHANMTTIRKNLEIAVGIRGSTVENIAAVVEPASPAASVPDSPASDSSVVAESGAGGADFSKAPPASPDL